MLYGNIIFIKKTGGDGSKFPVTERDIKIGKSEECLIRIYNPQVAPQHCQLIIEENGQATLRNFSNQTTLNGKLLGHKDVVLCHGDIFKLGERLARWEYLPTSKYYRQLLSPTGRLVAVVMPQQRPLGEQATPRTSVSQVDVPKTTPLGKRRHSERARAESSLAVKRRKSCSSELICKSKSDLSEFLTGRHSSKTTKLILRGRKPKERKSISGMVSSKPPKEKVGGKTRKSTLPLWKVNIASPLGKTSSSGRSSLKKSHRESMKSPKSVVKTPNKITESEFPEKFSSASKCKMKTPQKALINSNSSEKVLSSTSKSDLKTSLKTVEESPSRSDRGSSISTLLFRKCSPKKPSLKSPSNFVSSTPKPKSKFGRLVHSESKINSTSEKRSSLPKRSKRMTFMIEKMDFTPRESLIKTLPVSVKKEKSSKIKTLVFSDKILQTRLDDNISNEESVTKKTSPRKSLKNTYVKKTFKRSKETIRKNSEKKTSKSARKESHSSTSRTRISKKLNVVTPQQDISLINLDSIARLENSSHGAAAEKNNPLKKKPAKSVKKIKKIQLPLPSHKISYLSSFSFPATTGESASLSKARITSPRGLQRKLSPSSSAERAAKKLKTSSPIKPDKNKKAALLVLGKANRKHLISQNVKVLLKQKIVKKALKQSGAVSGLKDESKKKFANKLKQGLRKTKTKAKPKNFMKTYQSSEKGTSPSKTSKGSDTSPTSFPAENVIQEDTLMGKKVLEVNDTPTGKKVLEVSQLSASKILQTPFSSKANSTEVTPKSLLKQNKKSESFCKINNETISPSSIFKKNAENYFLNSFRRCSKRLSCKNDTGRPDFIELSPTALGLMPKHLEIFKTPKDYNRRSSSLVTPKNVRTTGIIKSASTSKIVNRKSVRFSPKDASFNSAFSSPNSSEKTEFDFSSFCTPKITMDVFVSPLSEKGTATKKDLKESKVLFVEEKIPNTSNKTPASNSEPKFCVRKLLQSPKPIKSLGVLSSDQKIVPRSPRTIFTDVKGSYENKSPENYLNDSENMRQFLETPKTQKSSKNRLSDAKEVSKLLRTPKIMKSPKNELKNLKGVKKYMQTSKIQKSPKNDLTDVRGVKKLMQTPKVQESPKNDLTDVRGVKKLMQTPKVQKSPKNDLTDVRGVKKLLHTPKVQKSPKNDLTDVRGVKKLMQTPKVQKSPKNDLTDVRGVKKLLHTPKVQKSPKNDLTNVRGVKKLMQTPKVQKSPKNDLTNVRGVKKLLHTPKVQKSPKNELSDLRGVKKLLHTPKVQKSPKNDLTDVRGVKKLMQTPKVQKSPKNDLTDVRGVKKLMQTPKMQKSPKNDLTDVRGVKKLMQTPKVQKSPKNELSDLRGVKELLGPAKFQKSPTNNLLGVNGINDLFESAIKQKPGDSMESPKKLTRSPYSKESSSKSLRNTVEAKKLLIPESPENNSANEKGISTNSHVNNLRATRGRRTIYSTPKGPKNDLSDVIGVRELFLRHKPSDCHINLTGVAELFNLTKSDVVSKQEGPKNKKKSYIPTSEIKSLRPRKALESQDGKDENMKITTRGSRLRRAAKEETEKNFKLEAEGLKEKKPAKRKTVEKEEASPAKKPSVIVKKSQKAKQTTRKSGGNFQAKTAMKSEYDNVKIKDFRKRKTSFEAPGLSPPKLKRKLRGAEKSSSIETKETPKIGHLRSKTKSGFEGKTSVERVKKVSVKIKEKKKLEVSSKVQIKKAIKTAGTKQNQKVQNKRSQSKSKNISGSEENISPRKTRSGKTKTSIKKASVNKLMSKETVSEIIGMKELSPAVKRSTRRKVK